MYFPHLELGAVPVYDLQWTLDAGLAEVPILPAVVLRQLLFQSRNVHILVIVEMAKPAETRKQTF